MGFEAGKFSYEAVFDEFPLLKERQFQPSEGLQSSIVELIADVIWRQIEKKG